MAKTSTILTSKDRKEAISLFKGQIKELNGKVKALNGQLDEHLSTACITVSEAFAVVLATPDLGKAEKAARKNLKTAFTTAMAAEALTEGLAGFLETAANELASIAELSKFADVREVVEAANTAFEENDEVPAGLDAAKAILNDSKDLFKADAAHKDLLKALISALNGAKTAYKESCKDPLAELKAVNKDLASATNSLHELEAGA